jgi:hypothetical protein
VREEWSTFYSSRDFERKPLMADINNVKAVFRITPARLRALMQAFPEDLLHRAPAPGEWSPIEVLRHLIDADRLLAARTRAALAGEDQPSPLAALENKDASPLELVAQFEALRAETLILLDEIQEEQLSLPHTHPTMGLVSLHNLLSYWGGHDLMHLVQIEQALMQPFIPDSGPWHVRFAKHIPNPDAT